MSVVLERMPLNSGKLPISLKTPTPPTLSELVVSHGLPSLVSSRTIKLISTLPEIPSKKRIVNGFAPKMTLNQLSSGRQNRTHLRSRDNTVSRFMSRYTHCTPFLHNRFTSPESREESVSTMYMRIYPCLSAFAATGLDIEPKTVSLASPADSAQVVISLMLVHWFDLMIKESLLLLIFHKLSVTDALRIIRYSWPLLLLLLRTRKYLSFQSGSPFASITQQHIQRAQLFYKTENGSASMSSSKLRSKNRLIYITRLVVHLLLTLLAYQAT